MVYEPIAGDMLGMVYELIAGDMWGMVYEPIAEICWQWCMDPSPEICGEWCMDPSPEICWEWCMYPSPEYVGNGVWIDERVNARPITTGTRPGSNYKRGQSVSNGHSTLSSRVMGYSLALCNLYRFVLTGRITDIEK
ncbi:hypothetical protein J6590_006991 [Homalodisca vitripennis]|nr:hypothetical protein J6590_006991 [Homalodisca vitripennis]